MATTLYYMSGSPYAWRVWLALEHKGVPFELKRLSYDAGDLGTLQFRALNPRGRVPVLTDDGFALYESGAIVDYICERWPGEPHLLAADLRQRAVQRRMIREAEHYVGAAMERLVRAVLFTPREDWSPDKIAAGRDALRNELALWEDAATGEFLAGALSAVDFTLYPMLALVERMAAQRQDLALPGLMGPRMVAWMARMKALAVVRKTWPPHWA
jgi:glutathione S-transferase